MREAKWHRADGLGGAEHIRTATKTQNSLGNLLLLQTGRSWAESKLTRLCARQILSSPYLF